MDQQFQEHEYKLIPRWAGILIGILLSLFAAQAIWKHGLRNWEWVRDAVFAAMGFFYASDAWQSGGIVVRSWRSRIFCAVWGIACGAWIGHENGWVPGGCVIGLFVLLATTRESGWWSMGLEKPLGIAQLILYSVLVVWFVRHANDWTPFVCIAAILFLLGSEKEGRRSLRENILRPVSAAWLATAGAAFFWVWKEPSFMSVLALIAIPVIWFGNLLMHVSSGERVALSHPQS